MTLAIDRNDPTILAHADLYRREMAVKRRQTLIGVAIFAACVVAAAIGSEANPVKFFENVWRFPKYILDTMPTLRFATFGADMAEWFWGLEGWLKLLWQTILIAYTGTVLGVVGGFLLCFVAAANLGRSGWLRFVTKRYLEFCRTVPELVFALIFVIAFGLGPLPGVLAIAIHTMGAMGKLFSEVVENIDMKPVDGLTATGAGWWQVIRYAVVPQVLSNFASYSLLRFEINVRGASIMGFVGAGGIGQDLIEAIRKFYFTDVSAILLLIIVTVMLIDYGTERLRHALLSLEQGK
ncbi:MAG: phosphonate ABC transporter, permease protein PhnE [Bosea sp. (in: a-proteobacteria)]|jgi:phosphonate transport system permease protein|uniref:phosphonate ABC transporter, permease protein PhnE n=1 Tax=unclassified Bosea (in: a-proteobacteria) TaxID=2653178 RepID=UPI00083DCA13|nr:MULTISPECIES: phosphonate ABC transporter, permease protein PhnE [unclassified Bosea (in: a-proteobacteria)]AOG06462.1 phosphonate ABC transporter, permease protein PhnE [Bosea sp. RAC05]MDP3603036.1 phosphonate ABC transporter, permease protein PhnE [Bosea sp. (in: a-proteobacteria)]